MFLDHATIEVTAGTGGSGAEAFRREKGVPRGGPSGGDGGKGGDVILVADRNLTTLADYGYRRHYRAERGQHGQGSNKTGRAGEDLELGVPPGTVVRDAGTGEVLGELTEHEERLVVARGGRGGRGNASYASATHQAPREWEPGEEGEHRVVEMELKLIADVGLVGEPNAGKSTLLSAISAAHPKVAAYPFTTLQPNLGVVELPDYRSFAVADIPGIIEGAHEGKGLGLQFLRHVERTRTLAYLVPVDAEDPQAEYDRLREEIGRYSEELARRPHCLVLSKADLLGPEGAEEEGGGPEAGAEEEGGGPEAGAEEEGGEPEGAVPGPPRIDAPDAWETFLVSAVTRRGLRPLLEALWARTRRALEEERGEEEDEDAWFGDEPPEMEEDEDAWFGDEPPEMEGDGDDG